MEAPLLLKVLEGRQGDGWKLKNKMSDKAGPCCPFSWAQAVQGNGDWALGQGMVCLQPKHLRSLNLCWSTGDSPVFVGLCVSRALARTQQGNDDGKGQPTADGWWTTGVKPPGFSSSKKSSQQQESLLVLGPKEEQFELASDTDCARQEA